MYDSLSLMEKEAKTKEKRAPKAPKIDNKTDTSKVYELSYILSSSIQDEKLADEISIISKLITDNGGEIISSENPILIELAYPMTKITPTFRGKFSKGYFGWIKFEVEKEALPKIKQPLDLSNNVVRYLLINTVRENTLLNGKMVLKQDSPKKQTVDDNADILEGSEEVMNLEEVDKSIDNLVIA